MNLPEDGMFSRPTILMDMLSCLSTESEKLLPALGNAFFRMVLKPS